VVEEEGGTLDGVGLDELDAIFEDALGDLLPRLASRQSQVDVSRREIVNVEPGHHVKEGGGANGHGDAQPQQGSPPRGDGNEQNQILFWEGQRLKNMKLLTKCPRAGRSG
jgi:hypothetical protein